MNDNQCMLTTIDNPYNPFTEFALWYLYDMEKGYDTCGYLGRIVHLTSDMSQKEEDEEVERAIDEIIELNPLHIYEKRYRNNTYK